MELLGKSLEDLFQECGCKFSLKTVCMLALQMVIFKNIKNKFIKNLKNFLVRKNRVCTFSTYYT